MKLALQHGEYPLGRYKTQFTQFTRHGWQSRGPWMRAIVTNQRLVFMPDDVLNGQAAHSPASILGADVMHAWHVCLGKRDGAIVALREGQLIYLYVEWSQGAKLVKDVAEMVAPPVQPRILPRMLDKTSVS